MPYGFIGRILRIDLSHKRIEVEERDDSQGSIDNTIASIHGRMIGLQ